jgi:Recombinase
VGRSGDDQPVNNLAPIIAELQAAGVTSLRRIADELNRRGIPTPAGRGQWQPVQVSRVLRRRAG